MLDNECHGEPCYDEVPHALHVWRWTAHYPLTRRMEVPRTAVYDSSLDQQIRLISCEEVNISHKLYERAW
jgi:hypothetical protein